MPDPSRPPTPGPATPTPGAPEAGGPPGTPPPDAADAAFTEPAAATLPPPVILPPPAMPLPGPPPDADEPKGKKKKKKDKNGGGGGDGKKKDKGTERGVETMFRSSYRVNMDLSALADAKANIMISINGIIVSVLIASISPKMDANPWLLLPTSVMLVGCLVSLVFAVLAARPRVQGERVTLDQVRNNAANILFFGNFANMSRDDFQVGMEELMQNRDALYRSMISDVYGVGSVLQKKYRLLRVAYTVFLGSMGLGVFLFVATFVGAASDQGLPVQIEAPAGTTIQTPPATGTGTGAGAGASTATPPAGSDSLPPVTPMLPFVPTP